MSDTNTAFAELVAANPIPHDATPHPLAWAEAVLLEEIDARSESTQAKPQSERRRGLLVAAAAFAVILIAVGLAAFIANIGGGEDVVEPTTTLVPTTTVAPTTEAPTTTAPPDTAAAPTTQATTTTTEAPTVDAADQAAIDAFVAAFNAGDVETVLASLSEDALFWTFITSNSDEASPVADNPELVRDWFVFSVQQQTQMVLSSCSPFSEGRINCTGTFSDVIVAQSPLGPASVSVTFDVNEAGEVSYLFIRTNDAQMNAGYAPFGMWHTENYPDEAVGGLLFNGTGRVRLDAESLALWAIRVPEWLASLEG